MEGADYLKQKQRRKSSVFVVSMWNYPGDGSIVNGFFDYSEKSFAEMFIVIRGGAPTFAKLYSIEEFDNHLTKSIEKLTVRHNETEANRHLSFQEKRESLKTIRDEISFLRNQLTA